MLINAPFDIMRISATLRSLAYAVTCANDILLFFFACQHRLEAWSIEGDDCLSEYRNLLLQHQ